MENKIYSASEARAMVKIEVIDIPTIMEDIERRCNFGNFEMVYDARNKVLAEGAGSVLQALGYDVEHKDYGNNSKYITISWKETQPAREVSSTAMDI